MSYTRSADTIRSSHRSKRRSMFASLKNKIKEETGSDLSKITSTWRSGAFLSRAINKDDSSQATSPSSSGGYGDTNSESISPKLESYLEDRTGGGLDHTRLQQEYVGQLEEKLKERDAFWERKIEELKESFGYMQGEEAAAAHSVARTAATEAAAAASERDAALRQLHDMKERVAAAVHAQERLDTLTEELENARREWGRERTELKMSLAESASRIRSLTDELTLVKASLPPGHQHYQFEDDDRNPEAGNTEAFERYRREHVVLSRQLQEARVALADVKTSWSGQIASLETQVARMSRQAGEEGAERRRAQLEKDELKEELTAALAQLQKLKQNLANSEAKVARLNGEVKSLSSEVRTLRDGATVAAERLITLESRLSEAMEVNEDLQSALMEEQEVSRELRESLEETRRKHEESRVEVAGLKSLVNELQQDCCSIERKYEKEKREKDEALLRNAHMSQSIEINQCDIRDQENEITEIKAKVAELDAIIAQHKENQAACMIIKENETSRLMEIEQLNCRAQTLVESEAKLRSTVDELQTQLVDKNKKIKTLDNRIADMKKTLQRELQSGKSDLMSAEDAEISRRYLKHVVMRFLTARELEARQLTRALATLLRLSAQEEALLQAALPPRTGVSGWFGNLSPT